MSLDAEILGENESGQLCKANVVKRNGHNGVVVFTRPLHDPSAATFALLNDTYGRSMNQNIAFSGTPDGIHDGTDNTWWTGSALSGTWDFASAAQNHTPAGSFSISGVATTNNSEAQIERSSAIDANAYVAISGWIYISTWSTSGTAKDVALRLRLAGVDIGSEINISNYIDTSLFGEWQPFIIPTIDFSSDSIDQLVIKTVDIGGGPPPNYYLDDIQFEEASGFADFTYAPSGDQIFHVEKVSTVFVDAITESAAKNPLGILGLGTLVNGFLLLFDISDQQVQSLPVRSLQGLSKFAQVGPVEALSDGTTTMIKTLGLTDITLDGRDRDSITYRIQDNMSGLLDMEVWIFGRLESVASHGDNP